MKRDPMTVTLYRPNRAVEPSVGRDVGDIVLGASLLFVLYVIAVVVLA